MMYAKVIVGLNQPEMDKLFDYRIPEGMTAEIGVRVIVPFGSATKRRRAMSFLFPKKQRCLRIKSRSFLRFWMRADQPLPLPFWIWRNG